MAGQLELELGGWQGSQVVTQLGPTSGRLDWAKNRECPRLHCASGTLETWGTAVGTGCGGTHGVKCWGCLSRLDWVWAWGGVVSISAWSQLGREAGAREDRDQRDPRAFCASGLGGMTMLC